MRTTTEAVVLISLNGGDRHFDKGWANRIRWQTFRARLLQKGGDPAAPSGTATLLRLSPSYLFYPNWLL